MIKLYFSLLLLISFPAGGATLSWDFSETTELEASSLVYNHSLEVLHPTLQVSSYNGGAPPLDFEVGDGSDGEFVNSTYANFDSDGDVSGNEIVIDATEFPVLQVTNFKLDAGWTLKSVGGPLVIHSLTDVVIEGSIDCSGSDGENAVGSTEGSGGEAFCGGGIGGDGGAVNSAGLDGGDIDNNVTGGQGGNANNPAVAGGGGGSWNTLGNSTAGANSTVAGGQAGDMLTDPTFSNSGGGAGGGGGSGTPTQAGAGGGAGGGQVVIHAVGDFTLGSATNNSIGYIRADGGDGGDSNVPGGAGGGGAGGSINVFAAGRVTIFNTDGAGASTANGGSGGSNSLAANGGAGGLGRSWYPTQDFNFVGFYTPTEQGPVNPGTAKVSYSGDRQSAQSIAFDLGNTRAEVLSATITPASSDFTVELSGSSDNFLTDDTGFTTDFDLLENKRYLKIRIIVQATDLDDPDLVESLVINYDPGFVEDFDFTSTSCAIVKSHSFPGSGPFLLFMPLFLLLCLGRRKAFRK